MDPVEQLREEHENIKRGLKLLNIAGRMADDGSLPQNETDKLLTFFKNYADIGHHQKEEDILFVKLLNINTDLKSSSSPISVLSEQHVQGRNLMNKLKLMDDRFSLFVTDYNSLLQRHIEIEDEVFPVLVEDNLNNSEISAIYLEFQNVDSNLNLYSYLKILDQLEVFLL
ncbi:MAG: hemerythrin domain-containing protein [Candidatus Heimdallarchaeota archaeon]|nr:hemerythrin domain-containing protein [Candidatus Heimdallarchaeota archaeon]